MATVQDVLETLFIAKGVETYVKAYDKAIEKNKKLAEEQTRAVGGKGGKGGTVVNPMTAGIAAVVGEFGTLATAAAVATQAVSAGVEFMSDSFQEFAKAEDVLFRSTVLLNNIGSSLKPDALQDMAKALSDAAGIDDEAIVNVGTALASMGHSGDVTAKTLRTIADAAAATGKSMDQVTDALARGARGNTRGLLALRVAYQATGNEARDFNNILAEFDKRFAGAAAARLETAAGATDRLGVAMGNLKEQIGETTAPAVKMFENAATATVNFFTKAIEDYAKYKGIQGSGLGAASAIGKGADPATLDEQKKQTRALEKVSDALVRQVLGGPGTVARQSMTLRDVKLAMGG